MDKTSFQICGEPGRLRLCRSVTVSTQFAALIRWKCGIRWTAKNPIRIAHVTCHGTRHHQGARRRDMTATGTFATLRRFWLKHYDATEILIMDRGTEFSADHQQLCQSRGILPVVTDFETPWQNAVVERHGALFKMVFEKACSLEAPTAEDEIDELLNQHVGRALQSCSRTISLIPTRSRRRQPPTGASSPPTAQR